MSSSSPPSLGEKKTGSRRRNVIKEDLVAEEDEAASRAGSVIVTVSSTCGPVTVLVQPWTWRMEQKRPAHKKRLKWCRRRGPLVVVIVVRGG